MSSTDTETPERPAGPRVTRDEARDLGRLVRTSSASPENRYLAGVAGGIARHFDIDPIVVRIAFVITVFFGGAGLLIYGAGWLFLPDENDGKAVITLDARSRALAMWIAIGIALLALLGDVAGGFSFPWWIIPTLVIVLLVVRWWDRRNLPPEALSQEESAVVDALQRAQETTQAALDRARVEADTARIAALSKAQATTEKALAKAQVRAERAQERRLRRSRRGPLLFWFTLGLIALAMGALGVIDAAGAHIADPAYPALALGIIGLMLLLGSFWGRAGGLILVGLVTALILGITTAANQWDDGRHRVWEAPATASEVQDRYTIGFGELRIDLSRVSDLAGLDGRALTLDGRVGEIHVILPAGVGARADASVGGPGSIELFGHQQDGIDIDATAGNSAAPGMPSLTIDAHLSVGDITIESEDGR